MEAYSKFLDTKIGDKKSLLSFLEFSKIKEDKFKELFNSLEDLEKEIFHHFFQSALEILENNEQYQNFDAHNQLLSFYFTFFELMGANEKLVKKLIPGSVYISNRLDKVKPVFFQYIESLCFEKLNIPFGVAETLINKGEQNIYWLQFLSVFNFWLKDESKAFEKTDMFIEKSISLSSSVLNPQPINNLIDFTKFLFQKQDEKH